MSNIRELSQLASLINVIDESKSIGIIAEYPNAKVGIGTLVPTSKVDVVGDVNITGVVTAFGNFFGDLTGNASTATYASLAGISTYASLAGVSTSTIGGDVDVLNASISGISTLGFFSDDQIISQTILLGENTRYYSVHKNITVESGKTLTVGTGSTILLDRFNNLDDVVAKSVSSPFIMSYNQIVDSFTIPPNHNSMSVGPILSINSGATITVSINSNWIITP